MDNILYELYKHLRVTEGAINGNPNISISTTSVSIVFWVLWTEGFQLKHHIPIIDILSSNAHIEDYLSILARKCNIEYEKAIAERKIV